MGTSSCVSLRSRSSTFCLVLQWIHVLASVLEAFRKKSTPLLREGPCFLLSVPPSSSPPRYLAVTCSVSASPEEFKRTGILGDDFVFFCSPWFLAVTCSASASPPVQENWFSGRRLLLRPCVFDSHLFGASTPESTGSRIYLGVDFRIQFPYSPLLSGSTADTCFCQSPWLCGRISHTATAG